MTETIGISEVKAKLAAVCDRAAQGEVIRFSRRRGNRVENFELRCVADGRRTFGAWQDKFSKAQLDSLSAPLTKAELDAWNT
ncbi:hypothetical protein [Sinimarinibacterium thermocellulolyticum]|uniref:Uncharacterized protein n=1 Tax=Sinimarinibacterium thermocellulolyticum TaxID=3170016 RepID=A0ABV2A6T0_9GAMM